MLTLKQIQNDFFQQLLDTDRQNEKEIQQEMLRIIIESMHAWKQRIDAFAGVVEL